MYNALYLESGWRHIFFYISRTKVMSAKFAQPITLQWPHLCHKILAVLLIISGFYFNSGTMYDIQFQKLIFHGLPLFTLSLKWFILVSVSLQTSSLLAHSLFWSVSLQKSSGGKSIAVGVVCLWAYDVHILHMRCCFVVLLTHWKYSVNTQNMSMSNTPLPLYKHSEITKSAKRTTLKVTQKTMQTQPEIHANSLIQTHW